MPIYEYECTECGDKLEEIQKINDPLLTDCPACGKPALKKCVTAPAFRLKGGGWYETDFKSDKQKNLVKDDTSAKADKAADKKTEKSSSETKSESKPAAPASTSSD